MASKKKKNPQSNGERLAPIDIEQNKGALRKKMITIGSVIYVVGVYILLHYSVVSRVMKRNTAEEKLFAAIKSAVTNPGAIFPLDSSMLTTIVYCTIFGAAVLFVMASERALRKHDNPDTVNGSARLMNAQDLKKYNMARTDPFGSVDNSGPTNMILSKDVFLAMNGRKTRRNCNILVIGGSGAGKSRFFAAPNILQYNSNFVVTDPSGELLRDYGKGLENAGYKVKVFNIVDVYRSNRYNPFHYIHEEKDVFILVNTLIRNTSPSEGHSGDPFWEKCEKLLLQALILYLWHVYPDEKDRTFANVVKLIGFADVDENDASAESTLDILFKELEKDYPDNLAVVEYKNFKKAAGKTLKSIIISVVARMESFMLSDIQYLTNTDDLEFESFADTKQALFVILPTADTTFNFLVSLLYSQLFMTLYNYVETRVMFGYRAYTDDLNIYKVAQAESEKDSVRAKEIIEEYVKGVKNDSDIRYNEEKKLWEMFIKSTDEVVTWRGEKEELVKERNNIISNIKIAKYDADSCRCPRHVRLILDEFANIGQIPAFNEKLATIRKYEISCSIILQGLSQLKKIYKDDWNTIVANCDTKLFLGCDDSETIEWLVKMLGKKTTTVENMSLGSAKSGGSMSYNKSSRELLTIDEVALMKDDECIVRIRGINPYFGKKYELTCHPNYESAHKYAGKFTIPITGEHKNSHLPIWKQKQLEKEAFEEEQIAAAMAEQEKKNEQKAAKKQKTESPVEEPEFAPGPEDDGEFTPQPAFESPSNFAPNDSPSFDAVVNHINGSEEYAASPVTESKIEELRRKAQNAARESQAVASKRDLERFENELSDDQQSVIEQMLHGLTDTSTDREIREAAESIIDIGILAKNSVPRYGETE